MLVQGIPVEEESDTDSSDKHKPEDLGNEWDKTKCGDWSHCPSPPPSEGPTWAEATTET